jgi:hypothetical protein
LDDVPKSLQQINTQLPLLLHTLQGTQDAIGAGMIKKDAEQALLPAINNYVAQIELLEAIINKLLLSRSDSWLKRSKKALLSVKEESNVEKITSALNHYIQTLTFYHSAARSTLDALKGITPSILYNKPFTNHHRR